MKKVLSMILAACMLATMMVVPAFADETYSGSGDGKNGTGSIEVSVTLNDAKEIVAVEVTSNGDDAGVSDPAVATVPGEIVEKNSLNVDTVSGATLTSNGIIAAVANALTNAGLNPEDYKTAAEDAEEAEKTAVEESTDVLVIGAGMAGLTSALAAKQNGANVIVIDKMSVAGGTTNLAGGILVCVGSELFANNRLDTDNLESVLAFWHNKMDASGVDSGYPDYDRLENVLADTGATVDWLVESGVEFSSEPYAASTSYPMALANGGGAGLITMLVNVCTNAGIDLRLNTKGVSLVTDESGAVVGAVAETDDSVITFNAKSVVLATGGISQNEELVEKYSPKLSRAGLIPASSVSHTGDGLLMALEVGAGTFDVFSTPLYATTIDPELSALTDTSALTIYSQLGVNANGDRFGNEAVSAGWDTLDMTASDMIQDGNAPFWYVFDSSDADVAAILEAGVESGVVAKGDTAEELALSMHVYTKNFVSAFDTYNAAAAAGEDAEFGKDTTFLKELTTAPFYAVKVYPTTFGSAGGVTTTDQGRVTRQDGTVISGLYAAGEMSNRYYYNENYILAASLGLYSTMGRRAGTAAAEDALAK
jgi:flavocytochrome c